jgi:hypothetical protein
MGIAFKRIAIVKLNIQFVITAQRRAVIKLVTNKLEDLAKK